MRKIKRINQVISALTMLNVISWDKEIVNETRIQIYKSKVKYLMPCGAEEWNLNTKLR